MRIRQGLALVCIFLLFSSHSAVGAETVVIDAATNTNPGCTSYVPRGSNYSMQINAGSTTTISKIFIRLSSSGSADRIYIRSIDGIGSAGTLLATFTLSSEVNAGPYYESVFTGTVNVTSGTKYWVHLSATSGNICYDTTAPTNSGGFSIVTSGSNYQWAYGSSSTFTDGGHWNMRIYSDVNTDFTAPLITSTETFSVVENTTFVGAIKTNESSTITIFGGSDQAKFTLSQSDSTTASLTFISAPNFESPVDVGVDNGYQVVLRALDPAGNAGYETITASVTDMDEIARVSGYSISGTPVKGASVTITATINFAGKVIFYTNGKKIPGCINKSSSGSNPITATCVWRPAVRGANALTFRVVPASSTYFATTSSPSIVMVGNRSSQR